VYVEIRRDIRVGQPGFGQALRRGAVGRDETRSRETKKQPRPVGRTVRVETRCRLGAAGPALRFGWTDGRVAEDPHECGPEAKLGEPGPGRRPGIVGIPKATERFDGSTGAGTPRPSFIVEGHLLHGHESALIKTATKVGPTAALPVAARVA
jgi:hypothetical protein